MGSVHPKVQIEYLDVHPEERAVVKPFLSGFDVTRAYREVRSSGSASVFYLKPERFMAEFLGIDRELLLLYSPHRELQARTIEIHDRVLEERRTRLDPMGSVLVAQDGAVFDKVQDFLRRQPERPPIVAISTENLSDIRNADDLRTLFQRQFFTRDLFALESPLTRDATFFGRHEIVTRLFDRFRSGQNSGLFGLRRIGKTSVLFAVTRRCKDGGYGGAHYLDLSNPGLYMCRWFELLERIVKEIAEPLHLRERQASRISALNGSYSERSAAIEFKNDIAALLEYQKRKRLLLAMDEIEYITFDISPSSDWQTDFLPFWQALRSTHQDLEADFCFLLAGVNAHALEAERVGTHDNPLFSTVNVNYLGPFDFASVRDMVRRLARNMGLRCEEQLYADLAEEYGGHPFLVRQACSHLAENVTDRPARLTHELFEAQRAYLTVRLERNARQILNVLATWYPNEYELIQDLASGERHSFVEFAELSSEFTEHMEGYGLVRNARTDPEITVGLIASYLSRSKGTDASERGPLKGSEEDIRSEISIRRNRLEVRLRSLLRDGLRLAEGKAAKRNALITLTDRRKLELDQDSYETIWDRLYFDELARILQKHWDTFSRLFEEDKAKVLLWLDHVNRSRADAHARTLSEDDLAFLRVAFARLEEKLLR